MRAENDRGQPAENTLGQDDFPLDRIGAYVNSINIDGLKRTKEDFVQSAVKPLFKAKDFHTLLVEAATAQKRLERVGCFSSVEVIIDAAKDHESPYAYDVTYNVKELKRVSGGVRTMVGANEGSANFTGNFPNIVGRGERLNFDFNYGSHSHKSGSVSLSKPLRGPLDANASISLFWDKIPCRWSRYVAERNGGILDFSFENAYDVKHNLQWEGAWRYLKATEINTSWAVRDQSGHSFKSALRHIMTLDHRDQNIFPNYGILLKSTQEYAGLKGDIGFFKFDTHFQGNVPLPFGMTLQGALKLGVMKPLEEHSDYITHNIMDYYFLGGPQTLRGFEMGSIGKRDSIDMLGGKSYWTSGLHLYGPLPFGIGRNGYGHLFKTHAFLNAGNITDDTFSSKDFSKSFKCLFGNWRASCGIGIAVNLGQIAQLELNYCWPLKFTQKDRKVNGFQVGIGIDFI